MRKSKREKEKEREEAKRKEEEALAAKTYAEFVEAFEGDGRRAATSRAGGSGFVKAGTGGAYDLDRGISAPKPGIGVAKAFADEGPAVSSLCSL